MRPASFIAALTTLFSAAAIQAAEPATAPEFIDTFAKIFGEHRACVKATPKVFVSLATLKAKLQRRRIAAQCYLAATVTR
jgi:hypothetical protein